MAAKKKGIVKHFGITLEEEEDKYDATAQQDEEDMARINFNPHKKLTPYGVLVLFKRLLLYLFETGVCSTTVLFALKVVSRQRV
ncbi:hypothetical protein Tco_1008398, partial [Tanacetum coccineum]